MGNTQAGEAEETVKRYVSDVHQVHALVIWSKTYCGYCAKVKRLFDHLNKPYKSIELDTMNEGSKIQQHLQQLTGQTTVPSIWIRGKYIGGCDTTLKLYKEGKLKDLFEEKS
eukprot:TRINITY_DN19130_c0_g1_i1.p1 TRINITY_DN19130_c0_g1~~TRINITY_DN19130_c0_g1_i1.p1  ORF type:complete len:112 (-),score=20.92 TRINITY_DN19130_c0_g1_i1:78-413(-)